MENEFVCVRDMAEWLAGYAMPPAYAVDRVLRDETGTDIPADRCADAWEYHISTLIGCGLLEGRGDAS